MTTASTPSGPQADPTPTIASDGSATAVRSGAFGGIRLGWQTLLTTAPIYIGIVLVWIYFDTQTAGNFLTARNLSDMAQEFSYEAVLAIGVVFVLLLGEIDLSLGYLTLVSVALCSGYASLSGYPAGVAIVLSVVVCTILGLIQGFLIAWVRMPSFVVTLGGFLIFEGVADHILGGATINVTDPFLLAVGADYLPDTLSWLIVAAVVAAYVISAFMRQRGHLNSGSGGTARVVAPGIALAILLAAMVATMNAYKGVPIALAILAGAAFLFWFLAMRTPFGRHVYAVGGNQEASRRAGINTTAVRWVIFGISGFFAGIAGVMLVGYSQAGSTTTAGPDLLLDVISIAVIGGVSLTGGKGSVWAVLLGGLVLASINSGLNLMNTDPYYIYVIKGIILLLAIGIDVVGKRWDELPFRRLLVRA